MNQVQFQEEKRTQIQPPSKKGLTGWLVKKKIASNEKVASTLLLISAIILILIAVVIFLTAGSEEPTIFEDSNEIVL